MWLLSSLRFQFALVSHLSSKPIHHCQKMANKRGSGCGRKHGGGENRKANTPVRGTHAKTFKEMNSMKK